MSDAAATAATSMAGATAANPYPGLRPFREDEEQHFFGREGLVDQMVDKLAATRLLSVVGVSGSGKSSLVYCGLVPALHRGMMAGASGGWRVAKMRPGSRPLRALAEALAVPDVLATPDMPGAGFGAAEIVEATLRASRRGLVEAWREARPVQRARLLLVVDQFEELFRYRGLGGRGPSAGDDAAALVSLMLEAAAAPDAPLHVVLTMRSDFLGECTQFAGLAEAINRGQFLVPRMTRDERRAAIVGPARVAGADVDPVLLTQLVNDVGDNPDQLSILQHALNRTWAQWQRGGGTGPLTLAHYAAAGRMDNALNLHADRAFAELPEGRPRALCEALFRAVTDTGTDARGVRRPTRFDDLLAIVGASAAELEAVMAPFRAPSRAFLMPPHGAALGPDTPVDISHESLMRVWDRLKGWSDDEARSAQIWRRLAETAALNRAGAAGPLEPPELDAALAWRERERPSPAWAERYRPGFAEAMAFLERSAAVWRASLAEQAAAEARRRGDDEARREREARTRRDRFWLGVVAAVVTLGMAASVGLWLRAEAAARDAVEAKVNAEKAKLDAEALALSAQREARAALDARAESQRLEHTLARGNEALQQALRGAPAETKEKVERTLNARPLVYLQYADPAQAELARTIGRRLNDAGYSAPGVEKVGSAPSRTELRYFRSDDAPAAQALAARCQGWGAGPVAPRLAPGGEARALRHFELWLAAAPAPAGDLAARVADLNADDRAARLAAGQLLQSRHRDSAEAIGLVLSTLEPPRLDALSVEGRINALYYLARTDPRAWTPALRERGLAVARALDERSERGPPLGAQTRNELNAWRQKMLGAPAASAAAG